jgi:hypothetical protein
MKVAVVRLKVAPVLLDDWLAEMVALPTLSGVTVSVGVSPQPPSNVTVAGLTDATAGSDEVIVRVRLSAPWILQPFLPSLLRG